ncbi:MAG: bacteriohemerythrin [SAR324 cluster bacterium]|nr:bacteriohemerythrin [SAR324 cluster bacterium]
MSKTAVLDENPTEKDAFRQTLFKEGYEVFVVETEGNGEDSIQKYQPQLIVLSSSISKMGEMEGFRYIQPNSKTPYSMITLTGDDGHEEIQESAEVAQNVAELLSLIEEKSKLFGVPLLISDAEINQNFQDNFSCIRFVDRVCLKTRSRNASVYEVFTADPMELRESKFNNLILFEDAVSYFHFHQIPESKTLFQMYSRMHPSDQVARIYLDRCESVLKDGSYSGFEEMLQKVKWNDDLTTEVDLIDQQHRELFNRLNQLLDAIRQDLGKRIIVEVIRFLEAYTTTHFHAEEELMQESDYPFYKQHKACHTQFVNELNLLKEKKYDHKVESLHLVLRIRDGLVNWFTHHILQEDQKLASFLKNK